MNVQVCRSKKVCSVCDLEITLGTEYRSTSYDSMHEHCYQKRKVEVEEQEAKERFEAAAAEKKKLEQQTDTLEQVTMGVKGKTLEEIHSYIVTMICCKCGDRAIGELHGKPVCGLHASDVIIESV